MAAKSRIQQGTKAALRRTAVPGSTPSVQVLKSLAKNRFHSGGARAEPGADVATENPRRRVSLGVSTGVWCRGEDLNLHGVTPTST